MKKHQLASLTACLLVVLICLTSLKTKAGETPVVLREWAAFAGNTDSAFVVPVLSDGDYTYSATYKAGLPNGVDIVLTKYDKDGHSVWQIFWTGSGVGRDQPSDMVMEVLVGRKHSIVVFRIMMWPLPLVFLTMHFTLRAFLISKLRWQIIIR